MSNILDVVVLDEISHMLIRPDTFIGSVESITINTYTFDESGAVKWRDLTYCPALLKLFDEVIQNCSDFSKTPGGSKLNRIDVGISMLTGEISVLDNGGIPVEMHPTYGKYVPCLIFGELRSGTNYDDTQKRKGGGRNGLGAKLTNIFSSHFKVETADGKNKYEKIYESNRRDEYDPVIAKSKSNYTKISFIPDYDVLKTSMDIDNYDMIVSRVYEIAACCPNIEVYINGKRISVKGFESFVKKFDSSALYTSNTDWRVGIGHSGERGFSHISFVNSTCTRMGGTHLDYLADQLVESVRAYVKKKTKQDVKPADIKNHLFLYVDATVDNPKYTGQTKEVMSLRSADYGTSIKFDDKFIKQLIKSDIVAEIIEWADNKKKLQELKDLRELNKNATKTSRKDIDKYIPASQKTNREQCTLFICEGDSALKPLHAARDPKLHGIFALRGKPMSLIGASIADIKKNKEIQNLMACMGLEYGKPVVPENLRYGRIALSVDADPDGSHICGLMINNFYFAWDSLIKDNMIFKLSTPLVRVVQGKKTLEFFEMEKFETWEAAQIKKNYEVTYLKGLGGNATADFKKYMREPEFLLPITYIDEEDDKALDIAFGDADAKKSWLYKDLF